MLYDYLDELLGDVAMDHETLKSESLKYAGTPGVSMHCDARRFKPAFLDKSTGRIEISRLNNGRPAPVHIINWLPAEWAISFFRDGSVKSLKRSVISGFVCDTVFYTRDQVLEL
ncbi:MAG: hypothetical protein ABGY96_17870 [bacterium]|nr:hypothetical protein [Gammaproteobacteria bacterium]HIL95706.1 hypothetical protein [Pseudomonadales bacterium]